jgi:Holliday junction resolvasome RuvABC endonuclease subunit
MENIETLRLDIEKNKKQKGIPEILINSVNVLFLDISSSCTGYAIASLNIGDKSAPATIKSAGCLWFGSDWDHQTKYSYLFNAVLTYFEVVEQIDLIIHEQYSVNVDRMSGVLISPEITGVVKVAAKENGVKVDSILPQTWRAALGIKPDVTEVNGKKKRNYKLPTKEAMDKLFKCIPEEVTSNISNKKRSTPSDLYDALGVCLGWLKKNGYGKIVYNKIEFDKHIGHNIKE